MDFNKILIWYLITKNIYIYMYDAKNWKVAINDDLSIFLLLSKETIIK